VTRRATRSVQVGDLAIGGDAPVRIQSMTTAAPEDLEGTIAECVRLAEAGCELTRITTPTKPDAARLGEIIPRLRALGVATPISADIHFVPTAAYEAARHAQKVRINPGNFADHRAGGAAEKGDPRTRIIEKFRPLLEIMKARGVALRIGVNHGSLAERILAEHGDTPEGMVASALEYVRLAEEENFRDVVISMKSSNPRVMVRANRRLVAALAAEGVPAPLHLGVTEAGEGEDGRIKSAIGIGALLADGIGETIRVSLAEPPEAEIPVARELVRIFASAHGGSGREEAAPLEAAASLVRRRSAACGSVGGAHPVRIAGEGEAPVDCEIPVEARIAELPLATVEASALAAGGTLPQTPILRLRINEPATALDAARRLAAEAGDRPIILAYEHAGDFSFELAAAVALGVPLLEGIGDAIELLPDRAGRIDAATRHRLAISILQNSLTRISRVQIIACPSCGRTLFDLPGVTREVKRRFADLKGVKIAVMGCIVNGPGEMADADFGLVGGAAGRVNLYRGQTCVERSLPIEEAYDRLRQLIEREDA
jgi:(E)-4-hydroxy-3-methylbut-2-enyl-diphosphate synthase